MTEITLRTPTLQDADRIGEIIYEAFKTISEAHSFPPDFPAVEPAVGIAQMMIERPDVYGVAAEIDGRVVPPHVFADVTPDMEIAREEIFGPMVAVLKAEDEDHALELANDHVYGLSSAVFTQDLDRGVPFAQRVRAGMTFVNEMTVQDEAHVAFGGERNSGLGRFNGEWAIEEFTTAHTIGVKRL